MVRYHTYSILELPDPVSFKLVKEGDLTCWVLKSNPMKNFSVSPSSSDIMFFLKEFLEMKMYSRMLLFAFLQRKQVSNVSFSQDEHVYLVHSKRFHVY
jgi:hypothetical protein